MKMLFVILVFGLQWKYILQISIKKQKNGVKIAFSMARSGSLICPVGKILLASL